MSRHVFVAMRYTHARKLAVGSYDPSLLEPMPVSDLVASAGRHYKLVLVGDALMSAYELLGAPSYGTSEKAASGLAWLQYLHEHYDRAVWLNPEPTRAWPKTTIETVAGIFPCFRSPLDGLGDAVKELVRRRTT